MFKKILAGVGIGVVSVALAAAPSFAATDPGVLETINATGGTSATDGLKIDVALGNIQIGRNGSGQIYDSGDLPDPTSYDSVSSYPVVALSDGTTSLVIGAHTGTNNVDWDSFTSESALTDSGRSGSIVNHLTYGSGTALVTADFTISYTYPNEYFNVKIDLTSLGSDYAAYGHRIYWYADSYLEGSDYGYEFGGVTPGGQTVAGVYSQAGTQIEAFRQTAGQNLHWVAGYYHCPDEGDTAAYCGADSTDGFINDFVDFPDAYSTSPDPDAPDEMGIDNGFGVNSELSTAATDSMNFDLLFAACVNESPLPCADSGLGTSVAVDPALPDTGATVRTTIIVSVSAAIVFAFAFFVYASRRKLRFAWTNDRVASLMDDLDARLSGMEQRAKVAAARRRLRK